MTAARYTALTACLLSILTLVAQPFMVTAVQAAESSSQDFILEEASVIISEISPMTQADGTKEFIEIYNRTGETLPITNLCLVKDDALGQAGKSCSASSTGVLRFSGPDLTAGAYREINAVTEPDKISGVSLRDAGAKLDLYYVSETGLIHMQSFSYGDKDASGTHKPSNRTSFQLLGKSMAATEGATPGEATVVAEPPQPPTVPTPDPLPIIVTPPVVPACEATDVYISEIVANPAGDDKAGGEYIELYNDGEAAVSLEHCTLKTDKFAKYPFTSADSIPAKSYKALVTSDGLLNGGGAVTFMGKDYDDIVNYPALKDDQAYALIGGSWQISSLATPDSENRLPAAVPDAEEIITGLAPCPAGKFRNPETNRCKSIAAAEASKLTPCAPGKMRNPETNRCRSITTIGSSLIPCKPGQYRSPETNRCRAVASATASLTPCKPGQTRNPETNRCRKTTDAASVLKPCKEGYARNAETNRCRKESSASTISKIDDSPQDPTSHNLTLVGITASVLALFLVYEYRRTIGDFFAKLHLPGRPGA